ncbi:MAG: haloacid dehalogenase type II [Puniceicoccales bacterium]
MTKPEVLFFDVLGTVVDWRGSIAAEVTSFLERNNAAHIDAGALADAWVGRYDSSVDPIRRGLQSFATLDEVNLSNLEGTLEEFGLKISKLPHAELGRLNQAWHRLKPWPDSVEGISKMKERFVVAPLSDGHTRLLVNMAKHGGLPWDTVVGADISRAYKPMPQAYLRACEVLGVKPHDAMLIAAHDYDLRAARECGFKTALVVRENAQDPSKTAEVGSNEDWDFSAGTLIELANTLMAA